MQHEETLETLAKSIETNNEELRAMIAMLTKLEAPITTP